MSETSKVDDPIGGMMDDAIELAARLCGLPPEDHRFPPRAGTSGSSANTDTGGGTRYSGGKAKLVATPILGMLEVGRVSEYGAEKYALYDWHLGQSFATLLNCAARHLFRALVDPLARDPESGRLHLGHAAWNILAILHFLEEGRGPELDDVSPWIGVKAGSEEAAMLDDQPLDK